MRFFPEGPLPPFSLLRILEQWQAQRLRPEPQGERIGIFYSWWVLTLFCAILSFPLGGFGIPIILVLLVGPYMPHLNDNVLGIAIFVLIVVGFMAGWIFTHILEMGLRWMELRTSVRSRTLLNSKEG